MTIIHISFDFPDGINKNKTKAVRNLISSQSNSDNIVFSLNRTVFPFNKTKTQKEPHGFSLNVFGLPYGIFLFVWMFIAYKRIARLIVSNNIQPSIIHAHKLTFEGIIAFFLSKKFKIPYILTIRGYTDIKLLSYKRMYHWFYSHIIDNSKKIIFISPWTQKSINKIFKKENISDKYALIPNIVDVEIDSNKESKKSKKFITVFHFGKYKEKNIHRVILAFDRVFNKFPDHKLDIVGDGVSRDKISSLINKTAHVRNFSLLGKIENAHLLKLYSEYKGFILPSYPETFGLVFIEALSAGIPLIYAKNAGIDGFFNDFNIGFGVNHLSVDEIASSIEKLILEGDNYKQNIDEYISKGFLKQFSKNSVGMKYSKILTEYSIPNVNI